MIIIVIMLMIMTMTGMLVSQVIPKVDGRIDLYDASPAHGYQEDECR